MLTIEGLGGAPGAVAGMEASSSASSIIVSRGRTPCSASAGVERYH